MTLDDIDPDAFGLLVDWIYYQRVKSDGVDLPTLARLWIMGGRFLIPAVQNLAMDRIYTILFEATEKNQAVEQFREYARLANDFSDGENALANVIIRKLCTTRQKRYDLWAPEISPKMLFELSRALKMHHEGLSYSLQFEMDGAKNYYV
jgi:hypothetical protein